MKEIIEQYRTEGLSFFPIPHKSKQAIIEWKQYQERKPNDDEIARWCSNGNSNIAVVCGAVSSNLVVLDFDDHEKWIDYVAHVQDAFNIDLFGFTRLVRTSKGIHVYLRLPQPIKSLKFPKLDIKAEGGYVIAPPSVHPSGTIYECINPDVPIRTINSLDEIGIDVNQKPETTTTQTPGGEVIPEGSRNATLASLAGSMRRRGMSSEAIESALLIENKRCQPPLPDNEVSAIAKSVCRYPAIANGSKSIYHYCPSNEPVNSEHDKNTTENTTKPLTERVEDWIKQSSGWFSYDDIDKEFGLTTPAQKDNRWHIIKRLKDSGVLEQHTKNNKLYRFVNSSVRLIDFKSATNTKPLTIKYPFGIEDYFNTYPGNIVVVAGSPDAGKTAFLLNLIRLNQYDFSIYYQSSEMGKDELQNRLLNFEGIDLADWNFVAEERSSNFADVIRPGCVNIIDYMELSGDFYMVAEYLRQIHDKLADGIAIVALQKDPKSPQGRGGTFGLEKPRLYLNMDSGQIMIRKAKNWTHPERNPNGLILKYKIVGGCKFIITEDWHDDTSKN